MGNEKPDPIRRNTAFENVCGTEADQPTKT